MEPTSDPRPKEEDQHRCADDQPWNGDRREQQQLQQPLCPELEAREGVGGKEAIMLGPIIEGQFNTAFNWPLGAALSFTMLAIVLLILFAASPLLKRQLARA